MSWRAVNGVKMQEEGRRGIDRGQLHERCRFKYAFARSQPGAGCLGLGWRELVGGEKGCKRGMLSREAQWERAKRCVAAVPRVDWQPSAGETGVRVSALSLTHSPSLPQLPSPPSGGQAGLGWLELAQSGCLFTCGGAALVYCPPKQPSAKPLGRVVAPPGLP